MMSNLMRTLVVSVLIGVFALNALGKNFSAHVDKTTVTAGGSLRLTLEFDGQTTDEPNLTPLEKEFSILSKQTSQESSFVNGNHSAKTSWLLEILPKSSSKTLVIPSIKLGQFSSAPIAIAQSEQNGQVEQGGIAVTMSTDRSETYPNAEVILTVLIKTPMSLRNASLTKPEIKNAIVEPLIEGEKSESVEQGIKYFTYKQSYAVYPSKAGELAIPPVIFRGIAVSDRQANQGLRGMFSNGASVSMRSNGVRVKIKDVPAEFPKDHQFLALKSFVVIEAFDEANPSFEVNKATSRRFEMKAKGGLASFLPTIATPTVKDLQVYSEAGTKLQKTEPDGMLASSKFAHIYMPTAAGRVSVPEQDIYWWSVDEDKLKVTTIRALDFEATGVGAPPAQTPGGAAPLSNDEQEKPQQEPLPPAEVTTSTTTNFLWQSISAALFVLWIMTLVIFLWRRRAGKALLDRGETTLEHEVKERSSAIAAACNTGDAKAVWKTLEALLWWASRHRLQLTNHADVLAWRNELERVLYRGENESASEVIARIKRGVEAIRLPSAGNTKVAPLYPQ